MVLRPNRGWALTKQEFLRLMRFPDEWMARDMYPDELFEWQVSGYRHGHENGAEHDRNGAFHWWLRNKLTREQLENLLYLAACDPDPLLGNDLRQYISQHPAFDTELAKLENRLFKSK